MSVKQVFNTSAELDYPTVLPTLDLDFANSKTLDPRITFTRASGGSYVGADGLIKYAGVNEPRFDHDPVTGESLGFLVEEARTNLISNSYSYHNTYLTQFDTNKGIAPDGTNTASIATPNNGTVGGTTIVHQNTGITLNGTYTYSAFVKPLVSSWQFGLYDNNNAQSSTITVTLDANGNASATGQDTNTTTQIYPNGWVRIIFTYIASSNATNYLQLYSFGYGTGDGNLKAHLVWGVQYEQGAFPTSYIPTEGSTRTRAADNASITGTNFRDFYNKTESTVFIHFQNEYHRANLPNAGTGIEIHSNAYQSQMFVLNSRWDGQSYPNGILYILGNNGTVQSVFAGGPSNVRINPNIFYKSVFALKSNDYANLSDSQPIATGSGTYDPPLVTTLGFRANNWVYNLFSGHIKKVTYYPKRLTNQQLQTLTT